MPHSIQRFVAVLLLIAPALHAQPSPPGATPEATAEATAAAASEADPQVTPQVAPDSTAESAVGSVSESQATSVPGAVLVRDDLADLARVAAQLEDSLTALGAPSLADREALAARLDGLAQRSGELAQRLEAPDDKLRAKNMQLQAYNALAQEARQQRDEQSATKRLAQVRSEAWSARSLDAPGAQTVGDFWLMQADLADLTASVAEQEPLQRQAIERLERFVRDHPAQEQDSTGVVNEVKLGLARMHDQRGQSEAVARLHREMIDDASLSATVRAELEQWFGYLPTLGQPFRAKLRIDAQTTWDSQEHLGKVVLLHFTADWHEPAARSIEQVRALRLKLKGQPLSVLTVDVGHEGEEEPCTLSDMLAGEEGWHLYRQGPGQVSLQRMFEVRSLPRYVVIDAQGTVRWLGSTPAALARTESLFPVEDR